MNAFHNRVVWITGASSGIGEALALAFFEAGAKIVLSARSADKIAQIAASLGDATRTLALPLDVEDCETMPAAHAQVIERFGAVDMLVNNAGISQRGSAVETDLSVDRRIMAVNYFGPVALSKIVLPQMLARGSGHIVVISSVVGKFATPGRTSYSASKHALHGYFNALRGETQPQGVYVTLICPGYVRTNISVNALKGDGSRYNLMDSGQAGGIPAEVCAQKILAAVACRKEEKIIARREWVAILVSHYFPRLFSYLIRRLRPYKPMSVERPK